MEELRLKVRNQVIDLLQMVIDNPGDIRLIGRVTEELTTMAIRGTAPIGSKHATKKPERWDDFSERKEACIAP